MSTFFQLTFHTMHHIIHVRLYIHLCYEISKIVLIYNIHVCGVCVCAYTHDSKSVVVGYAVNAYLCARSSKACRLQDSLPHTGHSSNLTTFCIHTYYTHIHTTYIMNLYNTHMYMCVYVCKLHEDSSYLSNIVE